MLSAYRFALRRELEAERDTLKIKSNRSVVSKPNKKASNSWYKAPPLLSGLEHIDLLILPNVLVTLKQAAGLDTRT